MSDEPRQKSWKKKMTNTSFSEQYLVPVNVNTKSTSFKGGKHEVQYPPYHSQLKYQKSIRNARSVQLV